MAALLHVTRAGLALRNEWPEVFASGEYIALEVDGERAQNLIAFERRRGSRRAVLWQRVSIRSCAHPSNGPLLSSGATPRSNWTPLPGATA
jgi:maltooligosyltrehalose synthase